MDGANLLKGLGSLPELEAIEIYNGNIMADAMVILSKIDAPKFTNLTFVSSPLQDKGFIEGIINSGFINQLKYLHLEKCGLTATSMKALSEANFSNIEVLNLGKEDMTQRKIRLRQKASNI